MPILLSCLEGSSNMLAEFEKSDQPRPLSVANLGGQSAAGRDHGRSSCCRDFCSAYAAAIATRGTPALRASGAKTGLWSRLGRMLVVGTLPRAHPSASLIRSIS